MDNQHQKLAQLDGWANFHVRNLRLSRLTSSKSTGTSFIAEIPDPKCYMGMKGALNRMSHWPTQIRQARDQFEIRFDREDADKEMNVPVPPASSVGVRFSVAGGA